MKQEKKTVVLGASTNPERYSYLVVKRLAENNAPVIAVGIKKGNIHGIEIQNGTPQVEEVDTVTLYLGAENQKQYYDYILGLKPKRIIFNPGAENPELEEMAEKNGIEVLEACTLTMLSIGNF